MSRKLFVMALVALGLILVASGCGAAVSRAATIVTATPRVVTETATASPPAALPTIMPSLTPTPAPTQSGEVRLAAVGDVMLGRTVGQQILEKGPSIVFSQVQSTLDAADLRFANLECALTDLGVPEDKSYTLKAPPAAAAALQSGRFDLVSLANNHAMDYGFEGLQETQRILDQVGVASVGAGVNFDQAHAPLILSRNGLRMAFLAYADVPEERDGFDAHQWIATESTPGIAWADPNQIALDVTAARQKADVVIVMLHAGIEIAEYMSIITTDQRLQAYAAIDAGAALVIGSHPHQLESIELYHGGLIAYSLGNFVFDDYRGIANASIILQVRLTKAGFQDYDYVPVLIDNGLPHVITPELAPAIGTLVAPVGP
jgi:poly-gamma-glutamate capsule biosynthesis protein CapA/YwtB (metallophosphatase superfamily)